VRSNPLGETDFQGSRINEGNAAAVTQAELLELSTQWNQSRRDKLDKAVVADQARELQAPMLQDLLTVVGFDVSVMGLVKSNQDRHDLAQAQGTLPLALSGTTGKQLAVPERQKGFAEVIDMHE
jgi:hypothetical protein